jgi:hypothetical protein
MLTSLQLKKMRRFSELGEIRCTAKAEARMGLPAAVVVVVPPKPANQSGIPFPENKEEIPNWKSFTEKLSMNKPRKN